MSSDLARQLDERWHRNYAARQRRLSLKERAIAHLGGKCRKCGYDKCPAAFDFHHLDPREKDFAISSKLSWETVVEELKKCVLLCANCHREAHDGWHPDLLVDEEYGRGFGEDPLAIELDWDDENETTDVDIEPPAWA